MLKNLGSANHIKGVGAFRKTSQCFVAIAFYLAVGVGSIASADTAPQGLKTLVSNGDVETTVSRLTNAIDKAGLNVMAVVDHAENAQNAGLSLLPTKLVLFGSPKVGTPLMQSRITTAIDLPQKMLVWQTAEGDVMIGYNDPAYLQSRHNIEGEEGRIAKIAEALGKLASVASGS